VPLRRESRKWKPKEREVILISKILLIAVSWIIVHLIFVHRINLRVFTSLHFPCILTCMKLKSKQKIEVFLTDSQKESLRIKAKEKGISMAEVIKRALEKEGI